MLSNRLIGAIFLIISWLMNNGVSVAQEKTVILDELVISGNRISIPFSESSRNLDVISEEDLKKLPVQSVHEALVYSPGVDIRQRGPVGVQADIGIRGGTFEQSLVLINGIKMTDPQTGHHILSLPFSLDDVTRIEVLKGPGSRIFGQNAFAGAVNFITAIPEERELSIRGYGGGFGSYGGNIGLSLPGIKYRQRISVGHDASDGHRHNTDYRISNIFYQSEFEAFGGSFEFIGGFVDRKFGANGFYASPEATEQYEEVSTSVLSLGYIKQSNNVQFRPRVYWRWNDDKYLFYQG